MIKDMTIGQYYPGDSVLHRLDPRMKLVLTFAMIVVIFLCKSFLSLALIALFTIAAAIASKVPAKMILKSLKPIVIILIFTAALNILYTQGGRTYFEWWKISVTEKGVNTAIFTMVRIIVLVVISSLLTYTTTPTMLTDALIEEIDRIMNAQKARGADLETGGVFQRAKALVPIFVPLMVSSFRRAYELAFAMTCRCYTGGEGRTRMKQMKLGLRDIAAAVICVAVTAGIIVLNHFFDAVI